MSGLFSNLFDPGQENGAASGSAQSSEPADDGGHVPAPADEGSASSGSDNSQSDSVSVDGDGHVSADPAVSLSQSGRYEGVDGSDNSWAHSNEVGLHADTEALLSSTSSAEEQSISDG